jgi:amino acid transporter
MTSTTSHHAEANIPSAGFIVGTAFLFGAAFGALVIMGLGMLTAILDTDNPFLPVNQSLGAIGVVVAGIALTLVNMRHGLRRDNRMRPAPIIVSTIVAVLGYLIGIVLGALVSEAQSLAAVAQGAFALAVSPATLVVLVAAAVASWAFLGTLRWQARNAETKQYAPPQE